jgi:hypothetical protein
VFGKTRVHCTAGTEVFSPLAPDWANLYPDFPIGWSLMFWRIFSEANVLYCSKFSSLLLLLVMKLLIIIAS